MKVAMWTSWQTRCGIAAYSAELVGALRELGAEVDVVPVPYTDRDPSREAATLARLNAADLVHIQHEYTFFGGIAPLASSLSRYYAAMERPRIVTAHTVFTAAELLRIDQETRWRQRIAKRLLASLPRYRRSVEREPFRGAAGVIVHTRAAQERMLRRGVDGHRTHVLPAGLPRPAEPEPAEVAALRERLELEGRRVVTIFGFVTPDKGYEIALDALAKLPPAVKLVIAGGSRTERERPYLEQLRGEIRARSLTSRVAITGYLEEGGVAAVMALTDLVLVPHTAANGSYSVMVALAHGKPVLASDLACFRELAEDAGAVELFDTEDEVALAERAGFLLASAGARRQLAERARAYASGRTWRSVAGRTLAVYEAALAEGQVRAGPVSYRMLEAASEGRARAGGGDVRGRFGSGPARAGSGSLHCGAASGEPRRRAAR